MNAAKEKNGRKLLKESAVGGQRLAVKILLKL
jgi:hypothetical protein